MKSHLFTLGLFFYLFTSIGVAQEREFEFEKDTVKFTRAMLPDKYQPDTRVDNMGYWKKMAEAGIVPVAPNALAPPAINRTTKIVAKGMAITNSPDVKVTNTNSTQTENSVFVDPDNAALIINSNNSTPSPSTGSFYGADALNSADSAHTWGGTIQGPTGGNSGDPTTCINKNGRWFIGYINSNSGQSVAYSDNQGTTWTAKVAGNAPSGFGNMLDKNHMWIDNSPTSTYNGNLYNAWTTFGGANDGEIGLSRSTDNGLTWSAMTHISSAANAGSHNQGVNLKTGPNGEAYAVWAIYDSWPSDEKALAMARSLDGGATWLPATRIIDNLKGIRNHAVTQNMRVNSFPCMAVDISNGPRRGTIYVVWTNVNTPGVNTGQGCEIYLIKSTDKGITWSTPIKVNTDPLGTNKQHYLPWITCDPANGNVAVVFYDNRNVSSTQAEAWCAVSTDGAATFTDFAVSDVAFTPSPLPNMATGYMGDYLAIAAQDGVVYPCWADNRSGDLMTYVSPFLLLSAPNQGYETYYDHMINDGAYGNNNGTPDFGENLLLTLSLKNIGLKADTNVMVTLSCDSPLVVFADSTEMFGNFTPNQIKTQSDAFLFHISDSIANNTELVFNVKAVNNLDSVYYSSFAITALAPQLTITNIKINDPSGNNNQVLDPGEAVEIVIKYKNITSFNATNPVSHLSSGQSFITISNPAITMATIAPGQTDSAVFQVNVASIPFGSAAEFNNLINYSFQSTQKSFVESIGLIVEDWETGGFAKFPWSFAGNKEWEMDNTTKYEGEFAAKSKTISHNQTAALTLNYNVMYNDSISFFRKVSSEIFHDALGFYIDGVKVGQWSGNLNWKRVAYPVTAGQHTFKWEYLKDASGSNGLDAAWVDFIVFPPETKTMVYAGSDMSSCENLPVQMNATATNYQSLIWSTSGSGTFSDNAILNPVYTPSVSDVAAGSVVLTLNVSGFSYKEASSSSFVLTFNRNPIVNSGADKATCNGTVVNLLDATAAFYSTIAWSTNGDGIFSDIASLNPVYTPGANDKIAGTVNLQLHAASGTTCPDANDNLVLSIHQLPTVALSAASQICKGDSTQLSYQLTGAAPYELLFTNGDTRTIASDNFQEWIKPEANTLYEIQKVTDAHGCITTQAVNAAVQVLAPPVLNLTADTSLCGNLVLNLSANAQGAASYLWMPGAKTTPTISIDTAGIGLGAHIYTLEVAAANGCKTTAKSIVTFKNCTGQEEVVGNVAFAVFPNPTRGEFAIDLRSNTRERIDMQITDLNGKMVYMQDGIVVDGSLSKQFNVKHLTPATYMLVLENNKVKISKQLVIIK